VPLYMYSDAGTKIRNDSEDGDGDADDDALFSSCLCNGFV